MAGPALALPAFTYGLYTGGVTLGVPGPPAFGSENRAALFNGSSGNINTPFGFNPAGGSFTLEAWVRLDAFNGSSTSAILQQDGPLGRTLLKVEGGLREFSSHLGNNARLSGFPVSTGTWHHLALVYDDAVNQIRWYVDGAAYAVETVVPEPETAPLLIARHKSLSGLHFNGANGLAALGDLPLNQPGPHHLLVERRLLRRSNLDAHGEASTGGAAHFSGTHGVTLREVISYDNNGPSFRFTWQDTGFLIEDCTVFGNHGSEAWVGAGIWIEMSPGPGVIRGNTVFSNTGAGIALLEAGNLTLEDNLLIDNEAALVLRDDYHPWVGSASGVTRYLRDLRIAANRFHAWRRAALTTWTEDEQIPPS